MCWWDPLTSQHSTTIDILTLNNLKILTSHYVCEAHTVRCLLKGMSWDNLMGGLPHHIRQPNLLDETLSSWVPKRNLAEPKLLQKIALKSRLGCWYLEWNLLTSHDDILYIENIRVSIRVPSSCDLFGQTKWDEAIIESWIESIPPRVRGYAQRK